MLDSQISIYNYKILCEDRNKQGRDIAYYMKNILSYNYLFVFPRKIEYIFFEILIPNSKPIKIGTIYQIFRIMRGSNKQMNVPPFKDYTIDLFQQELSKLHFPNYQNYNDISKAYNDFIQKIIKIID